MVKKVTAAIMMDGPRVLIAKRKSEVPTGGGWEFPGGKIEIGETPELCLAREMQEEFAIEVEIGKPFGESYYSYDTGAIQLLAYWTRWVKGEFILNAHDEVRWVEPRELMAFELLPADRPLAEKLVKVATKLQHVEMKN